MKMVSGCRGMVALLSLVLGAIPGCSGQARQLPKPAPMSVHAGGSISERQQERLANIRRFLAPQEQQLLERSIEDLAADARVPNDAADAALSRAIGRTRGNVSNFCNHFVEELSSLTLKGPEATPPERVAFAVTTEEAYAHWIGEATRARYATPRDFGRAVHSGELGPADFLGSTPLGAPGYPLFVTDAEEFEKKGTGTAGLLCLPGKPAASYVVAMIPIAKLGAPLRVPTAADGACRPRFQLPAQDASAGVTCSGRPEFVVATPTLSAVEEFRLSR